ncbi:MAG: hypothetical protein JW885_15855 [Deltaproteobacteria bacterium]|nr:hypothetical protein [Candidatus Zymogenaceae bacterium]
METQPCSKRIVRPVAVLFLIAAVAFIGFNGAARISSGGLFHIIAVVCGVVHMICVVFSAAIIYPIAYRRGVGAAERILGSLFVPVAWIIKEFIVVTGVYAFFEALYYTLNPVNVFILSLALLEMGIAELFGRRRIEKNVRGSAVPAVVAVVVALGILSFLFWGIGVYSFYAFQEGYKAIFGFGVGV